MNPNRNIITTITTKDGSEIVVEHRNSLRGWANAIERRGIDIKDIVDSVQGLPESARVAR